MDVYFENAVVGCADVVQVGLYNQISGFCTLPYGPQYRLFVQTEAGNIDLCCLVPEGKGFAFYKRISRRQLPEKEFKLCVYSDIKSETVIRLREGEPFRELQILPNCRFQNRNGNSVLIVSRI